jgi:hypothetical protein
MDAARGHQQPPVTQPNNPTTTRNVGQQDMRKDGSGLVARSGQTAEQEKAVREEWQEMEEDQPSEENGSDSSYQGSTDSTKVR